MNCTKYIYILCLFFTFSCTKTNNSDDVIILNPLNNSKLIEDSVFTLNVTTSSGIEKVSKIDFLIDAMFVGSVEASPFEFIWKTTSKNIGKHTLTVMAYDKKNKFLQSKKSDFELYDNRVQYLGKFSFTIHITSDRGVWPVIDTTFNTEGEIRKYSPVDIENDFTYGIANKGYSNRRLSIQFWDQWLVIAQILESGKFVGGAKVHKSLSGQFTSINSVEFNIYAGGMGGGYSYKVKGIRK
jgi:hypothetical protein